MSKLLDRLERANRANPVPMGFGAAARSEIKPSILLVGQLSKDYAQKASKLAQLGVEAALFTGEGLEDQLSDIAASADKVPWGVQTSQLNGEKTKAFLDKGCDFFVVQSDQVLVDVLGEEGPAYVLRISADASDAFLRAIEELPVDVVLLDMSAMEPPLKLQHLVTIGSVRAMFGKYLMVEVPAPLSSKELEALRNVGVDGLVVDVGQTSMEALGELKERLANLPRPRKPGNEKLRASLPHAAYRVPSLRPPDEDDEEEDEP